MKNPEQTILRLERQVRRLRQEIVAMAIFGLTFLLASAVAQQDLPSEIALKHLSIVDEQGRSNMVLRGDADGNGELLILDANGEPLVILGTSRDGHGAMDVMNRENTRVVSIGVSNDGDGGVRVDSREGSPAFYVGHDLRGNGRVPDKVNPGRRLD